MYHKFTGLVKRDMLPDNLPDSDTDHKLFEADKRQLCSHCYRKNVKEMGRNSAKNKTNKTKYRCEACIKHMCLDCFFELHSSKLK